MNENQELEVQKQIYEYSIRQLAQLNDSKKHLEGKCMNILQASSILVTLFVGLLQYLSDIELRRPFDFLYTFLTVIFYILIIITIILIIWSLNDKIVNIIINFSKKHKFLEMVLIHLKLLDKIETDELPVYGNKEEEGLYISLPEVLAVRQNFDKINNLKQYYQSLIICYENTIKSLEVMAITKNSLFLKSLKTFVLSILILIIMGILVA
jgi:hypothetical protein